MQHNVDGAIPQEYYRWPLVATAARSALDTRYRLLDYMYTAFHAASVDGTPVLQPLWFAYPQDTQTFGVDLQFFYGPSVLVSPVTEENAMSVSAYLPKDIFYDWTTLAPVQGEGKAVTINANYTEIPVHIKGGAILPVREKGAMTTTELRKIDFELIVALGADGKATGSLYVDEGESIVQQKTSMVKFEYAKGVLKVDGKFDYPLGVNVARVRVLGVGKIPTSVKVKYDGKEKTVQTTWDEKNKVLVVPVGDKFDRGFTVTIA
jgi:alpha-glucosidase